jgi:methylated-DNA-protein-cysteine methyltransferase-like protein
MPDESYFDPIYAVIRRIPPGRVMSYGQVGREAGGISPRVVGWAMANPMDDDIPWQRVVGVDGYLRIGRRSVELQLQQRQLLEREGVTFLENDCVDMQHHQVGASDSD